jgi:hypothetical protein
MWPFRKTDSRAGAEAAAQLARLQSVADPKERFDEVVRLLLVDHPPARPALDGPPPSGKLTEGQETLASVAVLDHQVQDGGLLQLFWSCPWRMEHIAHSLRALGLDELARDLDRAVNQLEAKFEEFERLRTRRPGAPGFARAAKLFDFEWFDDKYFGRRQRGTMAEPGVNLTLYEAALRYVYANRDQFVRP